jgi:hypothetical protein
VKNFFFGNGFLILAGIGFDKTIVGADVKTGSG